MDLLPLLRVSFLDPSKKKISSNEFFSCFRDNRDFGLPLFIGAGYADSTGMTIEKCAAFCSSQSVPYRFMGITAGFQCCMSIAKWIALTLLTCSACDNYFEYIFESEPGNLCETPCPGNPLEAGGCGGMDGFTPTASTYIKNNLTFITPALVPSLGLWDVLGCYKLAMYTYSDGSADTVSVIQSAPVLFKSGSTPATPL